jgi:hypothetical protein
VIKNQVAILDKIGETAWAVTDDDGWLWKTASGDWLFPSRNAARALVKRMTTLDLTVVKVKLCLA